jgi:anti-sigma regulatory factor (Ser/Thr protein kinase)
MPGRAAGKVESMAQDANVPPAGEARRIALAACANAAAAARRWLSWLERHLGRDRLDDARLIVTELVNNSVLHAGLREGDPIHLTAGVTRDRVRVSVCDGGRGLDTGGASRLPPPDVPGHRGLWLVHRLADRVMMDAARGRVTFELTRRAAPAR